MADKPNIDSKAFKQFENEGYSKIAKRYSEIAVKATSQVNGPMLDAVNAGAGMRILDVPCGPGALSADGVQRGAAVFGLDISENMVEIARSQCPDGDFRSGDAENLPFDNESFDAVLCSFGILHFPDPDRAMKEVLRVLKPGGHYAFTCWLPPDKNPLMGIVIGSIQAHGTMDVDLPEGPPLFRFGDPAECEKAVATAGFQFVSAQEVPIIWASASPEAFVGEINSSTARLKALFDMQTKNDRRNIEEAVRQGAEGHLKDGGVEIPMPALLTLARKP